jgi:hypothetical protein
VDVFGDSSSVIITFGRRVTSFQIDEREVVESMLKETAEEELLRNGKKEEMSLIHLEKLNSMSEEEKNCLVFPIGLRSVAMRS